MQAVKVSKYCKQRYSNSLIIIILDIDNMKRCYEKLISNNLTPKLSMLGKIIEMCSKIGDAESVVHYLSEMKKYGFQPDAITYSQVMNAFAKRGDIANMTLYY